MGFYTAKKTLNQLLRESPTLLSNMSIPTGLETIVLNRMLIVELGDLETIFSGATFAQTDIGYWSIAKLPGWKKMYDALIEVYDPLHNYDRTDTETETTSGSRSETDSRTGSSQSSESASGTRTEDESAKQDSSSTFAGTTINGGKDTATHKVQGFNSADYQPSEQDTTEHGLTQSSGSTTVAGSETETGRTETHADTTGSSTESSESGSHAAVHTDTTGRTLHSVGNIGVTTSQQMLESELQLRAKWMIYGIIVEDFKRDLCVDVW